MYMGQCTWDNVHGTMYMGQCTWDNVHGTIVPLLKLVNIQQPFL